MTAVHWSSPAVDNNLARHGPRKPVQWSLLPNQQIASPWRLQPELMGRGRGPSGGSGPKPRNNIDQCDQEEADAAIAKTVSRTTTTVRLTSWDSLSAILVVTTPSSAAVKRTSAYFNTDSTDVFADCARPPRPEQEGWYSCLILKCASHGYGAAVTTGFSQDMCRAFDQAHSVQGCPLRVHAQQRRIGTTGRHWIATRKERVASLKVFQRPVICRMTVGTSSWGRN
jgi:hypothetical protein